MSRKSFLSTIWRYNLTAPWPTLCHCCGYSINNPMLTTAYYSCLTWRSLGVLYNKVRSQIPAKHLVGLELNLTPYPTGPFSLVFNVYGPLDYSPLVFNVYSSFLGCFLCSKVLFFYFFFGDFCHLVGWLSNGFTFHDVPVCISSIHKVKELLAKMKVSVLVI